MPEVIGAQLRSLLNALKGPMFENNIPYMYVDTARKITVGVGHNLSIHKDALSLPFVVARFDRTPVNSGDRGVPIAEPKHLWRPATRAEKQHDFDFLNKHHGLGHYRPEHMGKYTTLELRNVDIDKLFEKDLQDALAIAHREFGPAFDKFSIKRQAALVDIAFNVGSFKSFQNSFVPAIKGLGQYKTSPRRSAGTKPLSIQGVARSQERATHKSRSGWSAREKADCPPRRCYVRRASPMRRLNDADAGASLASTFRWQGRHVPLTASTSAKGREGGDMLAKSVESSGHRRLTGRGDARRGDSIQFETRRRHSSAG